MPRTIRPVGSVPLLAEAAPTSSAKAVNNATGRSLIRRTVLPAPNCGPTPFYGVASRYFRRMELGFALSSEDHPPNELVRQAQIAERAGFTFGLISDHFHPWVSEQGHSPFVWSTLGGIAQATESIRMGTGVTCPLIRIHPAIVAQAAATVAAMMPGRFFLGVGTGENLNEHVAGGRWPGRAARSCPRRATSRSRPRTSPSPTSPSRRRPGRIPSRTSS